MDKVNEMITFFQNIEMKHIVNLLIGLGIFVLFKILSSKISYIIIKIFNMKLKGKKIKENGLYKPLKYGVIFLGAYLGILFLGLPEDIMKGITKIFKIILIVLTANGLANLITPKSKLMKKIQESDHINVNEQVTNFIGKVIRTIIYIIAGYMIAYELEYDLSGIITGLGIGSVVIALASQDIAKNLCSGVVLLVDKPFNVGEYIKIGNFSGTVEDITFRAVRIRTTENTVVTIPNSKISEDSIINYSKIEKRDYSLNLPITQETDITKVNDIINKITLLLKKHPHVIEDSIAVHFDKILDNGLNIRVFCYFDISDYGTYLDIKQELNEDIMNLLNTEKVDLAYDTKTIYMH